MDTRAQRILVGLGGWEHDILDQCFYPRPGMNQTDKLRFYARHFRAVEVRPTFWDDTLGPAEGRRWAEAVSSHPRFLFHVKLHSSFTHRGDVRPTLVRSVRGLLSELVRQHRLGGLLMQFPYAFTNTSTHRMHLARLAQAFRGFPLYAELRHDSWNSPILNGFLQEMSVHLVHPDMPRIRQYMPFITGTTGDCAYLRLHGRNDRGWLFNGWGARYDYLYNGKELREVRRRVQALPERCRQIVITWNNTASGKALANAFEISSMLLEGKRLEVPPATLAAFPHLREIAPPTRHEGTLFHDDVFKQAM